ncbi:MAG: hypothetical protein KY410_11085 [Proteobacteria bacterium]|nr:hypothetical protein [Pseudomonadota bacterium]
MTQIVHAFAGCLQSPQQRDKLRSTVVNIVEGVHIEPASTPRRAIAASHKRMPMPVI